MARVRIDNSKNLWPGTVTIADLAANTAILKRDSDLLSIYEVQEAFEEEWKFEVEAWEYEYGTGYSARFKDGSVINVGAYWTQPRDEEDQFDD